MLLEATLRIRAGSQICFTYEQIGADPERDTYLHCAACARPRKKKKTEKTKKKALRQSERDEPPGSDCFRSR